MKRQFILKISFILILSILTSSCNHESYIEGEGYLTDSGNNNENKNGSITIYSNSPFACSVGLIIYVDDQQKGTLIEHKISGTPNCGENSNSAITLFLIEGVHKIEIRGSTPSVFCPNYTPYYINVEKGRCLLLQIG